MLEEYLGYIVQWGELYASTVIYLISYYSTHFEKFLETVDFTVIYDYFAPLANSVLIFIFPDVEVLAILHEYFETYVAFPVVSIYELLSDLVGAYFSCLEVDFLIKLDRQLKVALCHALDKPHCIDEPLLYTLFEARPLTRKGFTRNSLIAEVYYLFCLFASPTFYLFVFCYFALCMFALPLLLINFIVETWCNLKRQSSDRLSDSLIFTESEKELGAIDDFIFVFLALGVVYSTYVGYFFLYNLGLKFSMSVIVHLAF